MGGNIVPPNILESMTTVAPTVDVGANLGANVANIAGNTVAGTATDNFDWKNFLGGDQFKSLLQGGAGLYSAYKAGQGIDAQTKIANQSMAMAQDAYRRDKEAEEKRQNLNF